MAKVKVKKEYLKQKEILKEVGTRSELKPDKVEEVYKHTSDVINEEILKGRKVELPHIGRFLPKWKAASTKQGIINPSTKEKGTVNVSEKYGIKFVPVKKTREYIDTEAKRIDLKKELVSEK